MSINFNQRAREVIKEWNRRLSLPSWQRHDENSLETLIASALERVAAEARNEALEICLTILDDEWSPDDFIAQEARRRIRQLIKEPKL